MNPTDHLTRSKTSTVTGRRGFAKLTMGALTSASITIPGARACASETNDSLARLRDEFLTIGMLIFEGMDQIDFTGPFSVLARLPNAHVRIIGLSASPVRDHKGLILTPDMPLEKAGSPHVLVVPGGPGQQALMDHEGLLGLIAAQAEERVLFSVCTGALLCGAAGVLRGRRVTTHWSSISLLPYFGALPVDERVVVDRNLISAAGITAGIDGALQMAALLRGPDVAQQIQLDIQYAPEPPFNAGTPETAPPQVVNAVRARYKTLTEARTATAKRLEKQLKR